MYMRQDWEGLGFRTSKSLIWRDIITSRLRRLVMPARMEDGRGAAQWIA